MEKAKQEHIITTIVWWVLVILPLILLLTISCSDDSQAIPGNTREYITISPFIESGMAMYTGEEFEENDAIGLYVVPYQADNTTPGSIAASADASNVEHIYHESSWLLPSGGKLAWPSSLLDVDLYSYYPYDAELDGLDPLSYPFSVDTDQQTAANYLTSDFLWSKRDKVSPTREPVDLIFTHKLSKVKVNVRSEIDLGTALSNAIVSIQNTAITANINLSDGTIAATTGSDISDIRTYKHIIPWQDYELSTEGIIIPQLVRQGIPFIQIDLPSDGTRYHYIPSEDIVFDQSTERAINITITDLGLSVTVSQITDWQPSEIIEGEIGKPLPKVVELNGLDWEASYIYHIYADGVWLAEICREHLNGSGINAQAIVVYTVDSEGNLNTTNGMVAQVMSYNATTFQYTPSTSNIHGGSVTWNNNNSIYRYTAGTSAPLNKLMLADGGLFVAAPDTYIPTLEASPYYVTDIDGNQYPTVKIASQYWMSGNLRVRNYNNGTPLTAYAYNDDPANEETFGLLYTWDTMMNDNGIAPEGWRLFSYDDFYTLYDYTGTPAGRKVKANRLWSTLGNNNDNITGYSAIPGGYRLANGTYSNLHTSSHLWTTSRGTGNPRQIRLLSGSGSIETPYDYPANYAASVRFIRE